MAADPRGERGRGLRQRVGAEERADAGLLTDIPVGVGHRARLGPVRPVGGEEGIGQRVVHPGRQPGVRRVVGLAAVRRARDRPVAPADQGDRLIHLRHGAERGRGDVGRRPGQAAERVLPVPRVVGHSRGDLRMGRLDEQGPDSAHEHGGVADDRPGHRARPEQPGVPGVAERVGQRVGAVREQAAGRGGHALARPADGPGRPQTRPCHAACLLFPVRTILSSPACPW